MKKIFHFRGYFLLTAFLACLCAFCFGTFQPAGAAENAAENAGETCFAFTYFTRNGEDGLHLLVSRDARKWEVTNAGKSYLAPMKGGLMRDPSICQAPDGTFHLVWTTNWFNSPSIGHSTSRDLINWTEPEAIPVMQNELTTRNVWAPEVFFDEASGFYYIIWASTIPGRFTDQAKGSSESKLDHRQYFTKTKDWKTFTESKLYFEPGHNVIDAFLAKKDDTYYLFYKDETLVPERKNILMATAPTPEGPWTKHGDISPINWVEGPSALYLGDHWLVCYDCYRKHCYGAIVSKDGKTWTDISSEFTVDGLKDVRHGTMFRISKEIYDGLKAK